MKISPARTAAYDILSQIERGTAHSSALLPQFESKLEPQDRGLCHELVLGVLRNQILLDRQIDALTGGRKIDVEIRRILRLALYQLSSLDRVPSHAAVNEAVNMVLRAKKTSARGFVNAVLRKFQKSPPEIGFHDEADRLAVSTSHPRWLVDRWIRVFGEHAATELLEFDNRTPDSEFRWTLRTTDSVRKSVERPDAPNRAEYLRELAANGKIYFQDRGSQMVAGAVQLRVGESFLDVCAAPGGKATLVALDSAAGRNLLVAGDVNQRRIKTLAENCRNQGADAVRIVQFDAAGPLPFADGSFDVVLVDAPCSGTGTIRRNPEIRHHLAESDFESFAGKQLEILTNASKLIKQGGRVIYSTCSLEREENEDVCEGFLRGDDSFRLVAAPVPSEFLTPEGYARTFPPRDKMDGFFVAVLEKK